MDLDMDPFLRHMRSEFFRNGSLLFRSNIFHICLYRTVSVQRNSFDIVFPPLFPLLSLFLLFILYLSCPLFFPSYFFTYCIYAIFIFFSGEWYDYGDGGDGGDGDFYCLANDCYQGSDFSTTFDRTWGLSAEPGWTNSNFERIQAIVRSFQPRFICNSLYLCYVLKQ